MSGRDFGAVLKERVEELAASFIRRCGAFSFYFSVARLNLRGDNHHERCDDGHVDGCCDNTF